MAGRRGESFFFFFARNREETGFDRHSTMMRMVDLGRLIVDARYN